jgi:large subunit ribosomal protein L27
MGKDHTLFALVSGNVKFNKSRNDRSFVSVIPEGELSAAAE